MAQLYPTLRSNEIYAALSNQVISQKVYTKNIAKNLSSLLDMNRVDGTLFGDVKTYFATDVLKSVKWGDDAEAENLLELNRATDPETQAIYLDVFRQIALTTDNYLSKRAWGSEGAFSEFNSTLKTWVNETKKIYETTLFNAYLGTAESDKGDQAKLIQLPAGDTEEDRRVSAQTIAAELADLFDEVGDVSRDYNDYGNLRSFDQSDLIVVWNAKELNGILKKDLPTIFHDDILDNVTKHKLPARYFGTVNADGGTTGGSNTTIRSLIEKDYNSVKMDNEAYDPAKHIFAGDLLPNNTAYGANETYTEDPTILFKVMYKRSIPFMTSMSVATDFFNPKSLTNTMFLTFGHNTLEYLKNYPMITVRKNAR